MPFYVQCRPWAILKTAGGGTGLFFADWLEKCSSLKCAYHEVIHVISWTLGAGTCTVTHPFQLNVMGSDSHPLRAAPRPCSLSPCRLCFRCHWLTVPWIEQRRSSHRVTVFLIWAQRSLELPPLKEDGACCLWTELFAWGHPDEDTARVD